LRRRPADLTSGFALAAVMCVALSQLSTEGNAPGDTNPRMFRSTWGGTMTAKAEVAVGTVSRIHPLCSVCLPLVASSPVFSSQFDHVDALLPVSTVHATASVNDCSLGRSAQVAFSHSSCCLQGCWYYECELQEKVKERNQNSQNCLVRSDFAPHFLFEHFADRGPWGCFVSAQGWAQKSFDCNDSCGYDIKTWGWGNARYDSFLCCIPAHFFVANLCVARATVCRLEHRSDPVPGQRVRALSPRLFHPSLPLLNLLASCVVSLATVPLTCPLA
jgi:hypothetical protein